MRYYLYSLLLWNLAVYVMGSPPNIVYILADDMGVGDVSCLNAEAKVATPHLDALASGGMVFTDAHTSSSVCTPTRYGLLTGRYNWRSELKARVVNGYGRSILRQELDTVPELLKRSGYRTAMIGKWHLGLDWATQDGVVISEFRPEGIEGNIDFEKPFKGGPLDHGFDYYFGINASLDFPPYTWLENDRVVRIPDEQRPAQGGKKIGKPQIMMRSGLQVAGFQPQAGLLGITGKAIHYINESDGSRPFFLYLPLNAPHTPVVPREEFLGSSDCGIYGDFIQEIDWSVGEVIAALTAKGLLENTLIIFTADNGASRASFPDDFEDTYGHSPSGIYKGRKASLDEGGHRVPFIAHWPQAVEAGSVNPVTCNLNDLYATCAEITSTAIADDAGVDSFSMLPLLMGRPDAYARDAMVHHDFSGRFAIRKGSWKLNMGKASGSEKLYNLSDDPSETKNLIKEHPEIAKNLRDQLTVIINNGRSTAGPLQENEAPLWWEQLYWIAPGE